MKIYAIEGLDGSGKSTLIKSPLIELLGVDRKKLLILKEDFSWYEKGLEPEEHIRNIAEIRKPLLGHWIKIGMDQEKDIIIDRWWGSTYAYQGTTSRLQDLILPFLLETKVEYIFLNTPINTCIERVAARGEIPDSFEKNVEIFQRYIDISPLFRLVVGKWITVLSRDN